MKSTREAKASLFSDLIVLIIGIGVRIKKVVGQKSIHVSVSLLK